MSLPDLVEISSLIAAFANRDLAQWDELRAVFSEDGEIHVSWYSGSIDGFIEASKRLVEAGEAHTKHLLGAPRIRFGSNRALAETDVTIMIRTKVAYIELDVTSHARFFDRLEKDIEGHWKIKSRTAIYEKDRVDSVGPSLLFWLMNCFANYRKYPPPIRHLAYGLNRKGLALAGGLVMGGSEAERQLRAKGLAWSGCLATKNAD